MRIIFKSVLSHTPNILIPFLVIFNLLSLKAQDILNSGELEKGKYKGYIINLSNDTIHGEIVAPKKYHNLHKEVEFTDNNGTSKIYLPTDLKAFQLEHTHFIGNTWAFVNEFPVYRPVFLQQLTSGYLKYYRLLNHELGAAGPIPVAKVTEYYLCAYGNLQPNKLEFFKALVIYTYDNESTRDFILSGKYAKEELPKVIQEYNNLLEKSDFYYEKKRIDSINSSTKLDLAEAEQNSLLFIQPSDRNMHEYLFRILYYAQNTPDYRGYIIYDSRDDLGRSTRLGLKITYNNSYKPIGTWRYFYNSKTQGELQIEKEESFDLEGKLHGVVTHYEKDGSIKKTEQYIHGNKVK